MTCTTTSLARSERMLCRSLSFLLRQMRDSMDLFFSQCLWVGCFSKFFCCICQDMCLPLTSITPFRFSSFFHNRLQRFACNRTGTFTQNERSEEFQARESPPARRISGIALRRNPGYPVQWLLPFIQNFKNHQQVSPRALCGLCSVKPLAALCKHVCMSIIWLNHSAAAFFLSVGQMYAQTPLGAHWQSMGRPMKNAWTNGVDGYKILIVQIAGLTEVEVQQRKSPELS